MPGALSVSGLAFGGGDGESLEGGLFWGLRGLPGDRVRGHQDCKPSPPPHLARGSSREERHSSGGAIPETPRRPQAREEKAQSNQRGPHFLLLPSPSEAGSPCPGPRARATHQPGHTPATSNSASPGSEVKAGWPVCSVGGVAKAVQAPKPVPTFPSACQAPAPPGTRLQSRAKHACAHTHLPATDSGQRHLFTSF